MSKQTNSGDPFSAIAGGNVLKQSPVNKFGRTTNADSADPTDIHDGANSTDDVAIWVAPTQARTHALVSTDTGDTCGVGTLTLTGLPLNTETTVIGSKTYTWQDTLTDVDGNVHIAADASDSLDNLIAAINLGAGAGTAYAASMTAGDDVVATVGAGDTMLLYDQQSQTLATTETLTNGSWGAATITAGTGARTVKLYGLKTWDTKETSETKSLHGTVDVNTTNDFVIIHRIKILTKGASGPNIGVITATAATDATVTAQINADEGQTQMTPYGIPSTQSLELTKYYASALKAAAHTNALITLLVNPEPQSELLGFLTKHTNGIETAGANHIEHKFEPYFKIEGPAIIKLQVNSGADNLDVSGGFDGILKDNPL